MIGCYESWIMWLVAINAANNLQIPAMNPIEPCDSHCLSSELQKIGDNMTVCYILQKNQKCPWDDSSIHDTVTKISDELIPHYNPKPEHEPYSKMAPFCLSSSPVRLSSHIRIQCSIDSWTIFPNLWE